MNAVFNESNEDQKSMNILSAVEAFCTTADFTSLKIYSNFDFLFCWIPKVLILSITGLLGVAVT